MPFFASESNSADEKQALQSADRRDLSARYATFQPIEQQFYDAITFL
jgi:hypothetical protein